MVLKNLYLFSFNIASSIGWAYILFLSFPYLQNEPNYIKFEKDIQRPLKFVQSMAFMEIIHVMFKLVKSNLIKTSIQVSSRLFVVWLIFYYREIYRITTGDNITTKIPYGSDFEVGLLGCALSWSCVEVPRYLYYALNIYGLSPYALIYLRYSLFTILYPTGISSELYSIWKMRNNVNPYCWAIRMPNSFNFAFNYKGLLSFVFSLYLPC